MSSTQTNLLSDLLILSSAIDELPDAAPFDTVMQVDQLDDVQMQTLGPGENEPVIEPVIVPSVASYAAASDLLSLTSGISLNLLAGAAIQAEPVQMPQHSQPDLLPIAENRQSFADFLAALSQAVLIPDENLPLVTNVESHSNSSEDHEMASEDMGSSSQAQRKRAQEKKLEQEYRSVFLDDNNQYTGIGLDLLRDLFNKNSKQEFDRICKFAKMNNADALFDLATCHRQGYWVKENPKMAYEKVLQASNLGLPLAHWILGDYNMNPAFVKHIKSIHKLPNLTKKQREERAFFAYKAAAEQNLSIAQYSLAEMYKMNLGVPKDENQKNGEQKKIRQERAFSWYKKAADFGLAPAQYAVAISYRDNLGVPENEVEKRMSLGLRYCIMAATQKYEPAETARASFEVLAVRSATKEAMQDTDVPAPLLFSVSKRKAATPLSSSSSFSSSLTGEKIVEPKKSFISESAAGSSDEDVIMADANKAQANEEQSFASQSYEARPLPASLAWTDAESVGIDFQQSAQDNKRKLDELYESSAKADLVGEQGIDRVDGERLEGDKENPSKRQKM